MRKPSGNLSKSRIMSGRQCARRLWLEVHRPEVAEVGEATERAFAFGHALNDTVRALEPGGVLIGHPEEPAKALEDTRAALARPEVRVLFESAFNHDRIFVRGDVVRRAKKALHLTEVKASTEVKDHYAFDCAVQGYVIQGTGHALDAIALAHVNNQFVYQGDDDYRGLLTTVDIGRDARSEMKEVPRLAESLRKVLLGPEPKIRAGAHCNDPYACPFIAHCEPGAYPVRLLPRSGPLIESLRAQGYQDLRKVPAELISGEKRERVWEATRTGRTFVDPALRTFLRDLEYPRNYLDFESIAFVVPIWQGTRPYAALPFQWSLHVESKSGRLAHVELLDTTGANPARAVAEALLAAIGNEGPIMTYGTYEGRMLKALAEHCPELRGPLDALAGRIVNLLPQFQSYYYHRDMNGSWSLKTLLPTVAPEVGYEGLGEVTEGSAAELAYMEIINHETTQARKEKLRRDLVEYCKRDTLALRLLVQKLSL
jgi:hypothetical protein